MKSRTVGLRSALLLAAVTFGCGGSPNVPNPGAPGTIVEFPLSGSPVRRIVAGSDGNLWFLESCFLTCTADPFIAKFTPNGTLTRFPAITGLKDIAAGPDGNIWFVTAASTPSLGKMSMAGTVQTFSAQGPGELLTVGPDSNLWVLRLGSGLIDVYSTSGAFLHSFSFGSPANASVPSIVTGPDNNVWLDIDDTKSVVRITINGVATSFQLSQITGRLRGMTKGPDGNLWLCATSSSGGGMIGRLTTSGSLTLFTVPTANSFPDFIATGPDGNLWFTEHMGNKIGRITPSGAITEFSRAANPASIVAGPDGFMWFAEGVDEFDEGVAPAAVGKIHP